mgnify:CR=1 FL=1
MTSKQLEKSFKKMLHNDIKNILDFAIEDWNSKSESGWVVFMEDFEEVYRCSPKMFQALNWYLSNPKKNHTQAKNSNSGYDRALALMDSNTGSRTLYEFEEDKDSLVILILNLRKKYN